MFNVTALRSGQQTARMLALLRVLLPNGESLDDVEWIAVDGPSPLASPTRNVVFISKRATDLRTVRDPESGFATVAAPEPPLENELVRIHVRAPKKIVRVPFFAIPSTVDELSLIARLRGDGGIDVGLRERCADPSEAAKAAAVLDAIIARVNAAGPGAPTERMFVDAKAIVEGAEARLDVRANADQVEAIVGLALTLARPVTDLTH